MKKTILAALCAAIAVSASAQNVSDALRFSQSDYYGTARSIAMGNAFTALGGDLGSVTINPAGSAVNTYSQITLTPSINVSAGNADYSSYGTVGDGNPYTTTTNNQTKFTMPNIGVMMYYNTHKTRGVRGFSLGLVGNATTYYNDDMSAGGTNGRTSYMGYLSSLATNGGLSSDQLSSSSYWDMGTYYWPSMVGYRSGMVCDASDGGFVGPAQNNGPTFGVRGDLDQSYNRIVSGSRYDIAMNMGMNIDNILYIGGNLGIVDLSYTSDSYIRESAIDQSDFPVTIDGKDDYFNSMRFHHAYSATGSGIYAKIGFIVIPVEGLRIGAAFQTPTANYITENLWYSGNTDYASVSYSETISEEDDYEYRYKLTSPARVNAGVAYTVKGLGLISADYEFCDYSTMKFRDIEYNDDEVFRSSNESIQNYSGASHMFRLGAEYMPISNLSVRAGYNFTTSGERDFDENDIQYTPKAYKQAVSLGLGYKTDGSFFLDGAVRCIINPKEYIYPYDTYDECLSPEIVNRSNLWNIVLTFGWRF